MVFKRREVKLRGKIARKGMQINLLFSKEREFNWEGYAYAMIMMIPTSYDTTRLVDIDFGARKHTTEQ